MKNILLIGGSTGIGKSIALALSGSYNVFATFHKNPTFDFGTVNYQPFDVLNDTIDTINLPDTIDGFVYCPGSIHLKPFDRYKPAELLEDLQLNVLKPLEIIGTIKNKMKATKNGSIVLFSSVAAEQGFPYHTQVAISKGALTSLSRTLAAELSPHVRVNTIAPSLTNTPLAHKFLNTEEKIHSNAKKHPLQAIGQPEDIANLAVFLLSEQSSWITAQTLHVDGGISKLKM